MKNDMETPEELRKQYKQIKVTDAVKIVEERIGCTLFTGDIDWALYDDNSGILWFKRGLEYRFDKNGRACYRLSWKKEWSDWREVAKDANKRLRIY